MNRRDLLKASAALPAVPSLAAGQAPAPKPKAAGAKGSPGPDWSPSVFDSHQNETIIAMTETIIPATGTPGAKEARVNRYLDLLLKDGPDRQRSEFLEGLSWVDGYAIRTHRRPFIRMIADMQKALLEELESATAPELQPGRRFVRTLKNMTARIYFNTQAGYQELNREGRVPATFGCTHAAGKEHA